MRPLRIEVLSGTALRLVGPAGEVLGRRELAVGEIDALVDEVTTDYEAYAPRLASIGDRLYAWLDGSGHRWLTKARESLRGEVLCVRLDVDHRLRHLPWELAAVEGAYLVADVANPFCPYGRSTSGAASMRWPTDRCGPCSWLLPPRGCRPCSTSRPRSHGSWPQRGRGASTL